MLIRYIRFDFSALFPSKLKISVSISIFLVVAVVVVVLVVIPVETVEKSGNIVFSRLFSASMRCFSCSKGYVKAVENVAFYIKLFV